MRKIQLILLTGLILLGAGCATNTPPVQQPTPAQSNTSATNKPTGDHDPGAPEDFELRFGKIIKASDAVPFTIMLNETAKIGLDFGGGVMDFYVTIKEIRASSSRNDIVVSIESVGSTAKSFALSSASPIALFGQFKLTLQSSTSSQATFTASEK